MYCNRHCGESCFLSGRERAMIVSKLNRGIMFYIVSLMFFRISPKGTKKLSLERWDE